MTTPQPPGIRDITALPRAVIAAAAGVVRSVERAVVGGPVRTAQGNAWEAVCADRARALRRAEASRLVAALRRSPTGQSSVGSSPRSIAAQAPAAVGAGAFEEARS
ncbi:MAG TPA: hypothetical protein VES42_17615 [Pilimelia sp.]|nr:hypothetical protein [Pilimelia sp.]